MTATLLVHGFERYVQDQLFLALRHGTEPDCNIHNIRVAIKLIKILRRRCSKLAQNKPRLYRFLSHSNKVLSKLLEDLNAAQKLYKTGRPQEAYSYIQFARIRHYDVRTKYLHY